MIIEMTGLSGVGKSYTANRLKKDLNKTNHSWFLSEENILKLTYGKFYKFFFFLHVIKIHFSIRNINFFITYLRCYLVNTKRGNNKREVAKSYYYLMYTLISTNYIIRKYRGKDMISSEGIIHRLLSVSYNLNSSDKKVIDKTIFSLEKTSFYYKYIIHKPILIILENKDTDTKFNETKKNMNYILEKILYSERVYKFETSLRDSYKNLLLYIINLSKLN